jgi:SAM-dependent methyltransferase
MNFPTSRTVVRPHQPPLPLPPGCTREQILASLMSFALDGAAAGELEGYAREDCDRFLYTLDLVPERPGAILEIGANPYFTTALMAQFRPQSSLTLVNYFGGPEGAASQTVAAPAFDDDGREQRFTFAYHNCNIEQHRLPLADESMDVVLFCEVIEHLLEDPMRALLELKRVLRPGGQMILTTPNVARLENVARMLAGANIYDPYSGYGPYGRHNREYNRHELDRLMSWCGYTNEIFFTADVHSNVSADFYSLNRVAPLVEFRAADLGQYLFSRWRKTGPTPDKKPTWLYRSYLEGQLEDVPL